MKKRAILILVLSILLVGACTAPQESSEPEAPPAVVEQAEPPAVSEPTVAPEPTEAPTEPLQAAMPFELTSTVFAQGEPIPVKYSCNGDDISPLLTWDDPPAGTQSLTLIMDDPDAPGGTWDHWILFNIPADTRELQEDLPITGKNQDPNAIFVGNNSWGRADYGGPCPPSGTHRYFFKLYALDTTISLLPGATKAQVETEMTGHILAQTELMGTFSK